MERHHTVRVLGPYGPEGDARAVAARMAEIQTEAWAAWLHGHGISLKVIQASLESDSANEEHITHREVRLRQALTRNDDNEVVQYFGAFATNGDMVGFAKFIITAEQSVEAARLVYLLAEIDILPQFQGYQAEREADQALAKKMIYAAIAHVRGPNVLLRLQVLADNERARALYERLGLAIVGSGTMDFEDAAGVVVWSAQTFIMEGSLHVARAILGAELVDLH